MNYIRLGRSDLQVSKIGLGCMSLGTEENAAIAIIHQALELGVNFLDTADLYDAGRNEELVGKAIRGRREKVVVATKVGNRRVPGKDGLTWDPSKAYILSAVKDSLRRLGTDYIDLYQLHGGTIDDPIDESIEAFEQLKQEGLIRHYGISSIRPNVIREYAHRSGIISLMSQYSLLDRRPEQTTLPLLLEKEIGLIARGPLAGGILTETGRAKAGRSYLDYSPEELPVVHDRLMMLTGNNRTLGEAAIQYVLSDPSVQIVLTGASSVGQLARNVSAASAPPLTGEEREALQSATKANVYGDHL
ncbi:MAG: putative oxidoreductase, aryl-alcohol dehydrogenase like protein [Paenibacillus sp.]|nr:putative oxidoreductase, aryl-alcohol dehydrogenase like protein [Paenibacillus sp.]